MQLFSRYMLFLIVFLLLTEKGLSQEKPEALREIDIFDKFGSVSMQALLLQTNQNYPYEYILKESAIRMVEEGRSISASIDYLIRIKVHTDDPLLMAEASLVGIPYYFADGIERVHHIEGITHHPDGRKSYLNTNRLRTVDLNSRYRIIEFEMPDVEPGAVLEYKYRLERRYIEELPDFYFSERVPTHEAILHFENSDFIRYNIIEQNTDFEINYSEQRIDTSSVPLVFTYRRPEPVFIQKWSAENIPAVDASSYISSIDDVRGKLKFQVSEFGAPRQPLENSWEFVTAQILRNNNPYEFIEEFPNLGNIGSEIARTIETEVAVQDSIFHLVNSQAQYNGVNAVFAERELSNVLSGEPANQAEINLTLLAILRGAGIDAKPIYISGREFGRINKSFPSLFQFNTVLIKSSIDDLNFLMDASNPFSLPNLITVDSFNEQGMVISEDEYEWIELNPVLSRFKLDIKMDARLTRDGHLEGSLTAITEGYPSQGIRQDLNSGRPLAEIISETFFDVYRDAVILNGSIHVDSSNRDRVSIQTDFRIPNYSVTFTDGLEFRPMVVGYLLNNPFETTNRRVPITLDAPEQLSINYKIELPDGYTFDVSGDTRSTSLSGASLFEEYFLDGNRIEYSFDIDINRKEFPADVYSDLRRIYERWVFLSNETWYIESQ